MTDAELKDLTALCSAASRLRSLALFPRAPLTGPTESGDTDDLRSALGRRALARRIAGCTFAELLDAAGGYRPTLNVKDPLEAELADHYDLAQYARGDERRAHRIEKPARRAGARAARRADMQARAARERIAKIYDECEIGS
ncbi:MAG: hypothetical protein OEZ09_15590 [Betaproteobacteria bacterium]|nr:hypothetical protein [Betaproteobacteria bacterium]